MAILLIGLAFGAEGDVLAYIVSRIFGSETYGAALGMLFAAVGVSAMIGAFILSQTLERWGNYTGFLFFRIGERRRRERVAASHAPKHGDRRR